jgi:uncharacterized iron-regulated membrane protein
MRKHGLARRWLERPQQQPLRRALFQVHLWLGLLLGVYIVVISVSGSAVVFRREFSQWLVPQFVPSTDGVQLSGDALGAAIDRVYADAGFRVIRYGRGESSRRPVSVLVERDGESHGRLFDPYASADLGQSYPLPIRVMEWFVSLHDDLLGGFTGRRINGVAGAMCLLLVLTGGLIWWPGRRQWSRSLYVSPGMSRQLWHLHSAIGFWTLLLLFNWSLSGWYMGMPGPIESLKDWLDNDSEDFTRPLDGFTEFITRMHFGRFGGLGVRTLWTVLGLLPAVLFVTGFIVWWRRVVRPRYAVLTANRVAAIARAGRDV